jgi:hypothetical protein
MPIGMKANERSKRRKKDWERNHNRHERGRYLELDDHDAVEGAEQQDHGHAHGDLKQGKPQQPAEREIWARNVCEWKEREGETESPSRKTDVGITHER